jgi:hypothetical protein
LERSLACSDLSFLKVWCTSQFVGSEHVSFPISYLGKNRLYVEFFLCDVG